MTTRYCLNCGSDDVITQRPYGHQPRRELNDDKAFVCVSCGMSIAWPAEWPVEVEKDGEG